MRRIVRYEHAQEEHRQAVEEQDSVEGQPDGPWDRLAGVLRLANGDTDELSTKVGKNGVDQGTPETVEFSSVTRGNVRLERTRSLVVLEASGGTRSSTDSQQEREDNDTDNHHDLDRTEPELEFTKELDTKVVDAADQDKENQNPNAGIDPLCINPLLDDQGRGSQLVGRCNDVFAPVSPSESETESRVTEAGSVTSETRAVRNPGSHFTKRGHNDVDEETNRGVSDEDRARSARVRMRLHFEQGNQTYPD